MRRTMIRFLLAAACCTVLACSSSPTAPSTDGTAGGGGGTGGGGGGGGATGNTTVLDDVDFDDNNWDTYQYTSGSGGTAVGGHFTIGGVANSSYSRVTLTANSGGAQVALFRIWRGEAYTPSGDGPIFSITYSEDARLFSGGGDGQYGSPALRQNGKLYALVPNGGAFPTPDLSWTMHTLSAVTQDQFRTLDSASDHPDFSSTGSRIEFGYMRLISTPGGDPGGQVVGGIDNWHLVLNR